MPKWNVPVTRTSYRTMTIQVEAEEAWAAEEMAIEQAANEDFNSTTEASADYSAEPAQLVEERINVGRNMFIPISTKCEKCGAGAQNLQFYDGMLGYEALECKKCGHQKDLNKEA